VIGGDTALMMAILDRLLHHGEVFYLRGSSHRLHGKEAVLSPIPPAGPEPPPPLAPDALNGPANQTAGGQS
jgi:hypothetical protein